MSSDSPPPAVSPAEKVKLFPTTPGLYLMKDAHGAGDLHRQGQESAQSRQLLLPQDRSRRPPHLRLDLGSRGHRVPGRRERGGRPFDRARLVKDIQPKHNRVLKDDKTFPYLQITTGEDFPRVNFTRQPLDRGVKLYGPFPRAKTSEGRHPGAPARLQVSHLRARHRGRRPRWRWFRPCLLASIGQCTAPCNLRIDRESYRASIRRLQMFLDGKKHVLLKEMNEEMREASKQLLFEKAARLRDEIKSLENLSLRGSLAKHAQPEVFYVDPRKGLKGLKKVLKLDSIPRTIDGVDIAHLGGNEMVGSLVRFVDGLPFKPGYRRYQIKTVEGVDDFAAIREVVTRRIKSLQERDEPLPDIWLIDGGKGQLGSALAAFDYLKVVPPTVIALAKREEEIYLPGRSDPVLLSRRSFALRLLQYVRDEAHRFAQHYHHLLRKKRTFDEEG